MKIIRNNVEQPLPDVLTKCKRWLRKEALARYMTVVVGWAGEPQRLNAIAFFKAGKSYSISGDGVFWRFEP